ncbi:MAG: DUF4157 domain-containing protein [Litoreibacter sp.]|uniref:eCIS core domain-containing protein n=1 Tax=Litoreibacter sp. TaxID=1969459 RepID=UPI00329710F9
MRPTTLLQPALIVGASNDPAEHEAEAMAARVVGASAPAPTLAAPNTPANAAPLRRDAEAQPNLDELTPVPAPTEQQDFDLPTENDVSTDGLDASDMAELESGDPVDSNGEGEVQAFANPRAVVGRDGGAAPADVSRIVANPGPGRALPSGVRKRIEPHFGTSFEDVRLHDTPADQDAAARIGARAFAHKNRIWLGRGESATNTRLMAHELTHVVQQTKGSKALPLRREIAQREEAAPEAGGFGSGAIEKLARYVPGYSLITVIMGRTLFSGARVLKTATNLLGGLFGLHPLGTVLFDKLRETNMVEEAFQWVQSRLSDLNLSWSRLKGVIDKALSPPLIGARKYIADLFVPLMRDIGTFVVGVGKKVLEFTVRGALRLAGPYADKVWAIIQQAGDVLDLIIENPLAFAKNLIKAVVGGFMKFGANILTHLKKGLLGWLFGAIAGAGITLPEKFDFKGLMSLVMQILGLTYATFRAQLVKQLGPSGERKVAMIEKSVEIVKVLLKEGFAGIWQKMLELIENFKATLIGGISSMVVTTVIKAGISWLAGLSNPVGAVVKVVLGIYDMIVAFLERLQQIMDVAQSIFSSIGAIARGQTEAASNFVEQTIGRTVPVVIAFLAAALGLGGISSKIKAVITKLQAPVKKAMGKMIAFVIKKAKKLFSKIIGKLNGKRKLPSVGFKIGKTPHEYFAKKSGKKMVFMIASEEATEEQKLKATKAEVAKIELPAEKAEAQKPLEELDQAEKETDKFENVVVDSEKQNNRRINDKVGVLLTRNAKEIQEDAMRVDEQLSTSSDPGEVKHALIRAVPPRMKSFEGVAASYEKLKDVKKQQFAAHPDLAGFYELDHTIEKQFFKIVLESLHLIDPANAAAGKDANVPANPGRAKRNVGNGQPNDKTARADKTNKFSLGQIGKAGGSFEKIDEKGNQLPAIALHQTLHNPNKSTFTGGPQAIIQDAIKSDPDKAPAAITAALKKQMDMEYKDILSRAKADPTIDKVMVQSIKEGLDVTYKTNADIFGFDIAAGPDNSVDTGDVSSNLQTFEGNAKIPNFLMDEGSGRFYKKPLGGIKGYMENDHILDQAYPKKARDTAMLPEGNADRLSAKVDAALAARGTTKTTTMSRRLARLSNSKLYPKHSNIAKYDNGGKAGWTVAIHKTLNEEVKQDLAGEGSPASNVANASKQQPEAALNAFRDYVLEPDVAKAKTHYATGAALSQSPVNEVLETRTQTHATYVKNRYDANKTLVSNSQGSPGGNKAAATAMAIIIGRARLSLSRASTETILLLPNRPTEPKD